MTVEEGDHAVVQKIGRRDRRLAIIELGASNLGIGVDKGLLVDTPDPLQIANIERVLGAAVAWMLALKFAMASFSALAFSSAASWLSVRMKRSCAIFASSAFKRSFMVVRSCRLQMERTPKGETVMPRF